MFEWTKFLDQHRIDYVTSGPNVARGNVAIKCPFCADDESHHMGISLQGKGWACWRRSDHRGKSAIRLVQALLRCSYEQAARLTQNTPYLEADLEAQVHMQLGMISTTMKIDTIKSLPHEFKSFTGSLPSSKPYVNYLIGRGFSLSVIERISARYDLRYCTSGPYNGRIIFPVYLGGRLMTWTGRSISKQAFIRYRTLSTNPEKAQEEGYKPAAAKVTDLLLWYDRIIDIDAHTIYLVEGPFDALKMSILGRKRGIVSTCLFTASISAAQVDLLHELLPRYRRKYLLLDQGAIPNSMRIASSLMSLGVVVKTLPDYIKDPGDLDQSSFIHIADCN